MYITYDCKCARIRISPTQQFLGNQNTCTTCIQGELDELEREEFFRLKKVQDKKERDLERKRAEKEELARLRASAAAGAATPTPPPAPAPAPASALPAGDADLIF